MSVKRGVVSSRHRVEEQFQLDCNGTDEFITLNSIKVLNTLNDKFEIDFFVDPLGETGNPPLTSNKDGNYFCYIDTITNRFAILQTGTQGLYISTLTVQTGQNNLQLIHNGTSIDIWINGMMDNAPNILEFRIQDLAWRSSGAYKCQIKEFTVNTEFFPCNEGTGTTTVGKEGTVCAITRDSMWIPL